MMHWCRGGAPQPCLYQSNPPHLNADPLPSDPLTSDPLTLNLLLQPVRREHQLDLSCCQCCRDLFELLHY